MVVYSKTLFDDAIIHRSCSEFMHPWSPSCLEGIMMFTLSAFVGCFKMSLALHSIQILYKGKNLTKKQLRNKLLQMIRYGLSGPLMCFVFMSTSCLIRNIRGRFGYYTFLSLPATISAAPTLFAISPYGRYQVITGVSNSVIETLMLVMDTLNVCKKTITKEMVIFMLSNAGLFYIIKLWKKTTPEKPLPEFWFYYPSAVRDIKVEENDENETATKLKKHDYCCPNFELCISNILKSTWYYFSCGLALGILKSFILHINKPKSLAKHIFDRRSLNLGIFLGTYVMLAKATNCLLCRLKGVDSEYYGLPAGMLSGLSYYFYPNTTLCLAPFCFLISLIWSYYDVNNKAFKGFPVQVILFMFSVGFLYHSIGTTPDDCAKIYLNTFTWGTNGRLDEMRSTYKTIMDQYLKTKRPM